MPNPAFAGADEPSCSKKSISSSFCGLGICGAFKFDGEEKVLARGFATLRNGPRNPFWFDLGIGLLEFIHNESISRSSICI